MKHIFITLLMFAVVMGAIKIGIFDIMSSNYVTFGAIIMVCVVLLFAVKVLGNPLTKDKKNDENKN